MTAAGAVVLMYHRVCHLDRDPYRLAVTPEHFQEQCSILSRRGDVVPLEELQRRGHGVAITFDDGYADNASTARQTLSAAGLPATFFIASALRESRQEAWWDRLEQLLLGSESPCTTLNVEIDGRSLLLDIRSNAARERAYAAICWRVRRVPPGAANAVVDAVETQLGIRSVQRPSHQWMSDTELLQLASTPGIDIGSHTMTHPFLTSLDEAEQRREVEGCRRALEALLARPVRLFSYPYGGPDAFDETTVRIVGETGYTIACTATGGTVRHNCDPLQLPRNAVADWSGVQFAAWLDRVIAS